MDDERASGVIDWPSPDPIQPDEIQLLLAAEWPVRRRQRLVLAPFALAGALILAFLPGGVSLGVVVAVSGGISAVLAYGTVASRARLAPALEVLWFLADQHAQEWQSIDGRAQVPRSLAEALTRLGSRVDDHATGMRLASLLRFGSVAELRSGLNGWHPVVRSPGPERRAWPPALTRPVPPIRRAPLA